jgi:hypothetical protein
MRDHREKIMRNSININKINKLLCVLCLPGSDGWLFLTLRDNYSGDIDEKTRFS